jgi:lipoprotein-anchoring transpeptidase ErfK/SrfK
MLSALMLFAAVTFAETKTLAVQICLDRAGCSCNTIDGQWGRKSQSALEGSCRDRKLPVPESPEAAYDALFAKEKGLFRFISVTKADLDELVEMPADPVDKAELDRMGYATIKEMFAERGHLSERALERLNPGIDWQNVKVGARIMVPDFPSMEDELSVWPKSSASAFKRPDAAVVKVSLSRFEITAYDRNGRLLGLYPCSIARSKAKLPPHGELKLTTSVARPNYTYTPDYVPQGQKMQRYIFPEGENCPVGVAWLGLDLVGYGIHGTPTPETIGNAESHGCFRLANWNAARLYALCPVGTKVVVEP